MLEPDPNGTGPTLYSRNDRLPRASSHQAKCSESMIRTVTATRYVTPLREGGSLPAIVEADDDGLYVLKFHGAGQGPRTLIAELLAGEIGRALGLPIPEIVFVTVDPLMGKAEPDQEIQDLLKRSGGLNLGLDFLPGSLAYAPAAPPPINPELAARIVWFDAFVLNVDRTPRNPNLIVWHHKLWLIDHGASLYFHHNWPDAPRLVNSPFAMIRDHILLPCAGSIGNADRAMRARLDDRVINAVTGSIPDDWLSGPLPFEMFDTHRAAYSDFLLRRLGASQAFVQEAERARTQHI
jgi:HipA-like kinase